MSRILLSILALALTSVPASAQLESITNTEAVNGLKQALTDSNRTRRR